MTVQFGKQANHTFPIMPVTTAVPSASPLLPLPRGRPPPTDPLAPPHLSGACCPGYLCSHSVAGPSSLWGVNHSLVPGALLLGALRRYMWRGLPVLWTPNRPVGHLCPRGWPCLTFRVPGHIVSGWHSRSGGEDWVSMPWGGGLPSLDSGSHFLPPSWAECEKKCPGGWGLPSFLLCC